MLPSLVSGVSLSQWLDVGMLGPFYDRVYEIAKRRISEHLNHI